MHEVMDLDLARKRVVEIAGGILAGRLRPLLGARYLSRYVHDLEDEISHDAWCTIVGVDSESDDLPIGPERQYWAPEALREKDKVAFGYEEKVAGDVIRVAEELLRRFQSTV